VCRCALQTPPLFYLSHCTCKFRWILPFFYDLVSRDVTISTVIFFKRNYGRNRVIKADLQNLHIIVQLHIEGHNSTTTRIQVIPITGGVPRPDLDEPLQNNSPTELKDHHGTRDPSAVFGTTVQYTVCSTTVS
jgi:hypothetical protein